MKICIAAFDDDGISACRTIRDVNSLPQVLTQLAEFLRSTSEFEYVRSLTATTVNGYKFTGE